MDGNPIKCQWRTNIFNINLSEGGLRSYTNKKWSVFGGGELSHPLPRSPPIPKHPITIHLINNHSWIQLIVCIPKHIHNCE